MRPLRSSLFAFVPFVVALGSATALSTLAPPAEASVSIAVPFESLVRDAEAVAVAAPVESKSVWEGGRIITYTRLRVEQGVAGSPGSEVWVRTLGGVVGDVGQLVDGEPVFPAGKSSLLFLRKFKADGTWEVSARAQGQFPVVVDDVRAKSVGPISARKIVRSSSAGALLPPKPATEAGTSQATPRLAMDVLHNKPLDDALRDVADAWKKLHPQAAK